jgi:hypothetical protein
LARNIGRGRREEGTDWLVVAAVVAVVVLAVGLTLYFV